jgi:3-isopropylmalate dehydratase small subunit
VSVITLLLDHDREAAALALVTAGISWVIYPFFAKDIIARNYLRKGWIPVIKDVVSFE